jgi:hypothetical protein
MSRKPIAVLDIRNLSQVIYEGGYISLGGYPASGIIPLRIIIEDIELKFVDTLRNGVLRYRSIDT